MKTLQIAMLALSLGALVMTGCKKDPCEDVTCQNGGTCNEGNCACSAGYEGTTCGTESRAKFLATYSAAESCTNGNFNYTLSITTSSTNVQSVILSNFYGVGAAVVGTVSGSSITIPNQTVTVQGTAVNFSGSGQISGNILTLSYSASVGGVVDSCTATCTKQ